jgi:polyhydroxyalkanoate synthesis regulator phasin
MTEEKRADVSTAHQSKIQDTESVPEDTLPDPFDKFEAMRESRTPQHETPSVKGDQARPEGEAWKTRPEGEASVPAKNDDAKADAEKMKKLELRAYENQKFARSVNQKFTEALKVIDGLVDEGEMSEDISGKLLSILKKDALEFPKNDFATKGEEESDHPFDKHKKRLDQGLYQTYIEVSEDHEAFSKLRAFDQYLMEADEQELSQLDKELSDIKSPMSLLKKILSVGQGFLEEGLGEFYKQGGFRKYIAAQKKETATLKAEIDKLTQKIEQYECYGSTGKVWLGNDSQGDHRSGDQHLDPFDKFERKVALDQEKRRKSASLK